jgi:hypothetical protein
MLAFRGVILAAARHALTRGTTFMIGDIDQSTHHAQERIRQRAKPADLLEPSIMNLPIMRAEDLQPLPGRGLPQLPPPRPRIRVSAMRTNLANTALPRIVGILVRGRPPAGS